MPGTKNLIPLDRRTKSEQKEICTAGGVASGVARRKKKAMREAAALYLSLPVSNKHTAKGLKSAGVPDEDADNQMAIIAAMVREALKGDARAARIVMDMLGEDAAPVRDTAVDDALSKSLEDLGKELESDSD